jgi:hypothetical protein
LESVWGSVSGIAQGSAGTRISNLRRVFTFQNFKGIILYAKNEPDYTRGIV